MLEEEGLEGSGAVLKKGDRETNSGCKLRNWFLNLCFCDHAVACSRLMLFRKHFRSQTQRLLWFLDSLLQAARDFHVELQDIIWNFAASATFVV